MVYSLGSLSYQCVFTSILSIMCRDISQLKSVDDETGNLLFFSTFISRNFSSFSP